MPVFKNLFKRRVAVPKGETQEEVPEEEPTQWVQVKPVWTPNRSSPALSSPLERSSPRPCTTPRTPPSTLAVPKSFPSCYPVGLPAGVPQHLAACTPSSNAAMVANFTGSSVFVPTGHVYETTYEEGIVFPLHTATETYNFGHGHKFVAACYCPKENKVFVGCDPKLQPVRAAEEDLKVLHAFHSTAQEPLPSCLPAKQDPVFLGGSNLAASYPDTAVANGVYANILDATFEQNNAYPPLHEFIVDNHGLFGDAFCASTERGVGDILVLREGAVDKIDEVDEDSDHEGRFLGLDLFKFLHLNMFRPTKEHLASALACKPAQSALIPPPCQPFHHVSVARGVTCGNLVWKMELRKLEGEGAEAAKPFPTRLHFFEEN